jgi:RNA polymerase-binding transcription factor DksA
MAKSNKKAAKPAKKSSGKKAPAKKPAAKKVTKSIAKKVKPAAKKLQTSAPKAKPIAKKRPEIKVNQHNKPATKGTSSQPGKAIVRPAALHPAKKGKEKSTKTRYSDSELVEFRQLIVEKLEAAKKELKYLQDQISRSGDSTADDTENKYASMDDGGSSMEREYLNQMAARQRLYLDHLDKALVRIQNKTYGICRVTGKLIDKERLRAVPHATLSMEAKLMQQHPQPTNNV